ncbi:MAG: cysteine synthase A [Cyclobacteriaceae bacterium]|nr:cysteine synthase A [Cyclobacteriaceae bacterium]
MILDNILQTIGCTPVVKLNKLVSVHAAQVLLKIESFNPGGSVKDRIAFGMIEEAEQSGKLKKGMTIIEPTSGNTGIGLAMVAAVKGYSIIFTMPESMSEERKSVLAYLGARLVLTPGEEGMVGAVMKAQSMLEEGDYFMPQQFENEANPEIHRKTTALEILHDLNEMPLDYLVVGVGTGGTITGVGEVLREKFPDLVVVAVEPASSAVLSNEKPGSHKIQGIGAGFIPDILNLDIIDDVIKVENEDAIQMARELCRKEGIFAGISSGANVWAAVQVAEKIGRGKNVLTFLPDTGERYISTDLFSDTREFISGNSPG